MGFQIHATASGTNSELVHIKDNEEVLFSEPLTLGSENNDWFWREHTSFMKVERGAKQICSAAISVSTGRKIISCGPMTHGVIFDETGFYNHYGFLTLGKIQQIKCGDGFFEFMGNENFIEGSFVHAFDGNSHNYYHWLIEGIPALFAIREAGIRDPALFLRKEHVTDWHKEYLDLLDEKDCFFLNSLEQDSISIKKLHWAESRYLDTLLPSRLKQVGSYFRNKIGSSQFKRVYIKRHASLARSVENAAEIESFLTSIGFVVVDLGSQSVKTQVALFAGADIVIGAHGAGLANLIFMQKKAVLLEILPDGHEIRNLFWLLANKVDVPYAFIRANVNDLRAPYASTMRVPLEDLKNMITLIEKDFT